MSDHLYEDKKFLFNDNFYIQNGNRSMRGLLLCLCLMGCGSVVIDTVDELEQLSPLEADPGQIAVAIDLPKGFAIYPESAILTMAVSRKDLGQSQSEEFVLQQNGVERAVFKIAPSDLVRLTQVQDQAHRWEVENPRATKGSIAVTALPCVLDSSADRSETFSVSLQLAADGPFMPLINQAKVSSVLSRSVLKELPVCPIEAPKPLMR